MGSIRDVHNVWRDNLVPASFRGAVFHVETSGRSSGRRLVVHQYPKRNIPYAEDLGRDAVKWTFNGYLILGDKGIGGNLLSQISGLIRALEDDDAGVLIHPTLGTMLCMCDKYAYGDKRQTGGYVEFDMSFVEAGSPPMAAGTDTGANLNDSAGAAETSATDGIKSGTSAMGPGTAEGTTSLGGMAP